LIQDFERPDLLPRLIECSLPTLLDGSRVPALTSWIEYGRAHGIVDPLLDLAEAETAFVNGEHSRSFALALHAIYAFKESSCLRWRAHAIAARSAHFSDRLETGLERSQEARRLAPDPTAAQHCLWTEFLCAYELERMDCGSILAELEASQDGQLDTAARLAEGRYLLSNLMDFTPVEHSHFDCVLPLLDRVHPQVRASLFLNYCDSLVRNARYAEAELVLSTTWDLVREYDLSLAIPSVCSIRAANAIGLRRYRHAELLLDAANQTSCSSSGSILTNIRALRSIVSLLKGDRSEDPAVQDAITASKAWQGLAYAVDALVSASCGDFDTALVRASIADNKTRSAEARSITAFTRAIVTAARSDTCEAISFLSGALVFAREHQRWNEFVWAYRAYPDLIALIASQPPLEEMVRPILISARDERLATQRGLYIPTGTSSSNRDEQLSTRERDVLRLVTDGLSNREIALKLFISEVTVKVHLRHIYRKLGVRNRVEAALYAVYSD
jgi:DNA-binding CsgD family transcriptional regulator